MFTVTCALDVEDLYYAVITRLQVLERMLKEAAEQPEEAIKHNKAYAASLKAEKNRLQMQRSHLEAHINDHDYRLDQILTLFPGD